MKKQKIKHDLVKYELDSQEEKLFLDWLKPLYLNDIVTHIQQTRKSYSLNDGLTMEITTGKKNKTKKITLIREKFYTPDFIFRFNPFLRKNLYNDFGLCLSKDGWCYVDIKGSFTKNLSSSITFPDRQAIMWDRHGIYVNKVICHSHKGPCLFKNTFCPDSFREEMIYKVGKDKGKSKIKYPIINEADFVRVKKII